MAPLCARAINCASAGTGTISPAIPKVIDRLGGSRRLAGGRPCQHAQTAAQAALPWPALHPPDPSRPTGVWGVACDHTPIPNPAPTWPRQQVNVVLLAAAGDDNPGAVVILGHLVCSAVSAGKAGQAGRHKVRSGGEPPSSRFSETRKHYRAKEQKAIHTRAETSLGPFPPHSDPALQPCSPAALHLTRGGRL